MEQRDFLKDQIEQLGKVLAKIVGDYFNLKTQGNIIDVINQTNQNLLSELNIDIEKLINIDENELLDYITSLNLSESHFDTLAKYLYDAGIAKKKLDNSNASKYFNVAFKILEVAESLSQVFTFDRINLKNRILSEL